ncbi:MAG: hypothetical protein KC549_12335, partial [Myxococcales bacterium]|nr:hypothetical protein [Myxococcales bacterium]
MKSPKPLIIALGVAYYVHDFGDGWAVSHTMWGKSVTRRSTRGRAFGRAQTDVLRKADRIAFNLQGIGDWKAAFEAGKAGFVYPRNAVDEALVYNMANTELATVLRDPVLLAKTTFYNGRSKVIPTK